MKRIIYMVLMNLLHAPIWFFTISRMAREEDTRTAAEKYGYISEMVKRINRRGRVTVTATGTEHIPSQDGFILFPKTAVCCNKERGLQLDSGKAGIGGNQKSCYGQG